MAALFFPVDTVESFGKPGFWAFGSGCAYWYVRQEVEPLELAALLADSKAKPSMLSLREYKGADIPEMYFARYYREDGSDFFIGTVNESPLTFPVPQR